MAPVDTDFYIYLFNALTSALIATAIADLVPPGLRVDLAMNVSELPDGLGAVVGLVESTNDPEWPCYVHGWHCGPECKLAPRPEFRIATHLWERYGVNAVCDVYDYAGKLDPYSLFIAHVEGCWYLADGIEWAAFTGGPTGGKLKLIRPIVLPVAYTA